MLKDMYNTHPTAFKYNNIWNHTKGWKVFDYGYLWVLRSNGPTINITLKHQLNKINLGWTWILFLEKYLNTI